MKKLFVATLCFAACTSGNPDDNSPHALGTIILGEHHPTGGGTASPIVSAGFIPDANVLACVGQVAGCQLAQKPICAQSCALDEFCSFDENCGAVCKPVCRLACGTGEVCVFDSNSQPTCVLPQTFDAGPLAFSGTTTAITLFPPYAYTASQQGAPFLGGAQLEVQAQGALGAGFAAFDEKYSATTFLQTAVPLDQLDRTAVFGGATVPIDWLPGHDQIVITLTGAGGNVTCNSDDTTGHYDIPREALDAAIGQGTTLSLTVERQRKEVRKSEHTIGALAGVLVQPRGWLELTTISSESTSFVGCSAGSTACGTGADCVDLNKDESNCGSCGHQCSSNALCVSGQCVDQSVACNSCINAATTTTCSKQNNTCNANVECVALSTCLQGCADSTCQSNCFTAHPNGQTDFDNLGQCLCFTACSSECKGQC
jgi:hypothetical protein